MDVRNAGGKLVCRIDPVAKSVEIVHKSQMTIIRFLPDGSLSVRNLKPP
jgi:hypothetical protein